MTGDRRRLGILVGGGPAPGINSAISACTIEAINSGLEVIGIYDGFMHLISGDESNARPLSIADVSRIHAQGGSVLRTSRANPTKEPNGLASSVETLDKLGIEYLVTIGGDDTAFSAREVADASRGKLRVAHVPKTIDNDLPLPSNMPTFGFETARHVGTQMVLNLMEDARTTNRWYLVVAMGRKSGHLALGIGKAAGATLTIIPEEFSSETITLDDVLDVLEGAILKRRVTGHEDGLAVVSEGVAEKMDPNELASVPGVDVGYDPHGHLRLSEIPLATILRRQIERRFANREEEKPLVDVTMGYELRSAAPIPFDIDYTRTLGYGAVRFLLSDENHLNGGLVCQDNGQMQMIPFDELRDPETGRTKIRHVDVTSQHYEVARKYMIRIEDSDLSDPTMVQELAGAARMTPADFETRFAGVA